MAKRLFVLFLIISSFQGIAQLETSSDFRRRVYNREYTVGVIGHSRGYAVNGRYLKYLDGFHKLGFEIDMSKLRHPKEVRTPNQFFSNSRGHVFGRENSLYTIRTGAIYESILFDKTDQGTISISTILSGGFSWGLLKPIYMQILQPDSSGSSVSSQIITVRYNHLEYGGSNIFGEANFFQGIGETKILPGIYLKGGFNFDFDLLDKNVTSLEAGVGYDYYFKEVPIFFETEGGEDINEVGFLQFYIAVNFGYKKN